MNHVRHALEEIRTTAHCIAKAGPLDTPTLNSAWLKFMRLEAMASGAIASMKPVWTKEWPTEPGLYWFFGHQFNEDTQPPTHHIVRVIKAAVGLAFVCDASFMYRDETGAGVWTPAELPDAP